MANQVAAAQISAFVKGIITEASPLTFPDNASIDEMNMVLNKDGSRRRRLGMDYEVGYELFSSGHSSDADLAFSSFVWKQPGGFADKEFLVIQSGTKLTILDSTIKPTSGEVVDTFTIPSNKAKKMGITSVDGVLVVVSGSGNILTFSYDGTDITQSTGRLLIRDLFGVADVISGVDLLEGSGITVRPTTKTDSHIYNLRNQTFSLPRYYDNDEGLFDPIRRFFNSYSKYQSNSDNLVTYLYADANDEDNRVVKRYFGSDNHSNPLGTNRAPLGYFIIDALDRGSSRLSEVTKLQEQYPQLLDLVTNLPTDSTPDGASVVTSYAGRVWYSGFSSRLIGGDSSSPRMTSYVLFSSLVKSVPDIFKCYQEGDPTSAEIPELVDTDGGFIRLDGAFNIQAMVNVGDALMVIAENGVWKITGGSGYGFNATNYLSSKITEHGCVSPGSVVVVDNTFMYWADDGIYHVAPNQYGEWTATNTTNTTIQKLFDAIPYTTKIRCQGAYDSYQREVRWLYNGFFDAPSQPKELILDVNLAAFYQSTLPPIGTDVYPKPVSIVRVPPFSTGVADSFIITGSGDFVITSALDSVVAPSSTVTSQTSELYYVIADSILEGDVKLTLGYYRDFSFKDWVTKDGVGIDARAFLLTGWSGGGDYQRNKQLPYITVYSIKTETGFDSEFNPVNPSSIIVQGQWGWTNLESSNKWTNKFQAYRHKRLWIPTNSSSGFDDGEYVVTTRNKLRGRGKVISLLFETEPDKDFHLLGWSYIVNVNNSV